MKRVFLLLLIVFLAGHFIYAQSELQKPGDTGRMTITVNPVKPDTANLKKNKKLNSGNPGQKVPTKLQRPLDTNQAKALQLYNLGNMKVKQKDYEGAIADYSRSLKIFENGNAYVRRGYTYLALQNFDSAVADAKSGLKLLPFNAQAHLILGVISFERGEYENAEKSLTQSIKFDKKNPLTYNYLAALRYLKKDYQGAYLYYDSVARLNPNFPDVFTNRGMMNHYLNKYKEAIDDFGLAIKADSNNANAYNNRGATELASKDYQAALNDLNKAISLKAEYPNAFYNRGKVKHLMGDLEGACADWKIALSYGEKTAEELIKKFCQ